MSDAPGAIPDGTYDVFIVDANARDDVMSLELTIVSGELKGEVLTIAARGLKGEDFELIGMPGTLTVTDATPSFRLDA